jgi:hypothetical protein
MTFQRDYVLRAIENFARLVAAIVARRRDGQTELARHELDELVRLLVGVDLTFIEQVGMAPLLAQLRDREQRERLAILLMERAEQARADGDAAASERWLARAAEARGAPVPAGERT